MHPHAVVAVIPFCIAPNCLLFLFLLNSWSMYPTATKENYPTVSSSTGRGLQPGVHCLPLARPSSNHYYDYKLFSCRQSSAQVQVGFDVHIRGGEGFKTIKSGERQKSCLPYGVHPRSLNVTHALIITSLSSYIQCLSVYDTICLDLHRVSLATSCIVCRYQSKLILNLR